VNAVAPWHAYRTALEHEAESDNTRCEENSDRPTATTRPTKLGQPLTRWSIRKLAAYLCRVHGHGEAALDLLLEDPG
jgi:hypothetical protein